MSTIKGKVKGAPAVPFMAEFVPLEKLWEGANAPYPSEHSARWAVRKLRDELVIAKAVALHRSRLLVHPVRFAEVAERAAIAEFSNRGAHSALFLTSAEMGADRIQTTLAAHRQGLEK